MIIKIVTLEGVNRKKDRSIGLRFTTLQEQTSEELRVLDELFQRNCVIAIKEDDKLTSDEISDLDNLEVDLYDKAKSPSKRLRNVLFVQHQQLNNGSEWKDYYNSQMEKIITHFKDKLD